jgi:hypothetical protein
VRALAGLVLLCVLALGLAHAAVRAGDQDTFVPPPENVAKAFVTHLAGRRPGPAASLVATTPDCPLGEAQVRAWGERLRAAVPGIGSVDAQPGERANAQATATVRVEGKGGKQRQVEVRLRLEDGLWKVDCLSGP